MDAQIRCAKTDGVDTACRTPRILRRQAYRDEMVIRDRYRPLNSYSCHQTGFAEIEANAPRLNVKKV
jgi:hypothetical protein